MQNKLPLKIIFHLLSRKRKFKVILFLYNFFPIFQKHILLVLFGPDRSYIQITVSEKYFADTGKDNINVFPIIKSISVRDSVFS